MIVQTLLNPVLFMRGDQETTVPSSVKLGYSGAKPRKSLKGVNPTFITDPVITLGGVAPGSGMAFADAITWASGGYLYFQGTARVASASISTDTQIFGGFYATSTGLAFKDGTNTAVVETTWGVGDVVTAVVRVSGGHMALGRA